MGEEKKLGTPKSVTSRRFEDWPTRLDRYIAENRDKPFSYDQNEGLDCCTFTWGAIEAMTGIAIGARFRGTYTTRRGSLEAMKNYCGRASLRASILKLMDEYAFKKIPAAFAQRGDVVLNLQGPGGDFLGFIGFNGRDVLGIGDGIRRVPVTNYCMAWRIA
jgi:hypothetical protein